MNASQFTLRKLFAWFFVIAVYLAGWKVTEPAGHELFIIFTAFALVLAGTLYVMDRKGW